MLHCLICGSLYIHKVPDTAVDIVCMCSELLHWSWINRIRSLQKWANQNESLPNEIRYFLFSLLFAVSHFYSSVAIQKTGLWNSQDFSVHSFSLMIVLCWVKIKHIPGQLAYVLQIETLKSRRANVSSTMFNKIWFNYGLP